MPDVKSQDRAEILVTPQTVELQIIEEGVTVSTDYLDDLNKALDIVRAKGINVVNIEEWH